MASEPCLLAEPGACIQARPIVLSMPSASGSPQREISRQASASSCEDEGVVVGENWVLRVAYGDAIVSNSLE